MKKNIMSICLILSIVLALLTWRVYAYDTHFVSEDFKLTGEIEVDAVTTATVDVYNDDYDKSSDENSNEKSLENVVYSEMEIYNMNLYSLFVLIVFIVSMIFPILIRKIQRKDVF